MLLYKLGKNFLAPKINHVLSTNGIVNAGSPYGSSRILTLAVKGTEMQAATTPVIGDKRFSLVVNTADTAKIVKIAL